MAIIEQVELNIPETKRLRVLHSFHMDILRIYQFCDALEKLVEATLSKRPIGEPECALLVAIVIAYARMFNTGVRRHSEMDAIVDRLYGEDEKGCHDYVMELRNKHIAHSVNIFEEHVVTVAVRRVEGEPPKAMSIGNQSLYTYGINMPVIRQLRCMCQKLEAGLNIEIANEESTLMVIVSAMSAEQLELLRMRRVSADARPVTTVRKD
jgi:hypothetical protein